MAIRRDHRGGHARVLEERSDLGEVVGRSAGDQEVGGEDESLRALRQLATSFTPSLLVSKSERIMSGLTLGLMSLGLVELEILQQSGTAVEKEQAELNRYAQNGQSEEAIGLFRHMRDAKIELDKITMVGVLSACASLGALELGEWMDGEASRRGLYSDVYVGTALIDMYAKCGNVDRAAQIFDCMPCKNVVSWNAMISALAFNGRGREAISLFSRMTNEEGACPNDTTLVALLSACVHSGLVDEGRRWFNSMENLFGIIPKIEHYSCMVDLLARSSNLEEAWDFIKKMPQKPDPVTLGALLCACRNQKNVEVGERIIKQILELEPSNSGNYVTSSKIYASSRRWYDSARMRSLMRERGVIKTPGCSWTEINSQVHEFRSGDSLHLRAEEINRMISMLLVEMEMEGYTPNIDLV